MKHFLSKSAELPFYNLIALLRMAEAFSLIEIISFNYFKSLYGDDAIRCDSLFGVNALTISQFDDSVT